MTQICPETTAEKHLDEFGGHLVWNKCLLCADPRATGFQELDET